MFFFCEASTRSWNPPPFLWAFAFSPSPSASFNLKSFFASFLADRSPSPDRVALVWLSSLPPPSLSLETPPPPFPRDPKISHGICYFFPTPPPSISLSLACAPSPFRLFLEPNQPPHCPVSPPLAYPPFFYPVWVSVSLLFPSPTCLPDSSARLPGPPQSFLKSIPFLPNNAGFYSISSFPPVPLRE